MSGGLYGWSMRVATIDVGTNTALLLIAGLVDGRLQVAHTASGFVRLGEGLDATGSVSSAALQRLRGVLTSHMDDIRRIGADHVIVTGTSASRDAANADVLHALVLELTGAPYRILSGDEEAEVTFEGAVAGWVGAADHRGPITVIDVGGGSTELVEGYWDGRSAAPAQRTSMNMGSVRVTERFLPGQPASPAAWQAADAFIDGLLDDAARPFTRGIPLLGSSGTAILLGLLQARRTDATATEPASVPAEELSWWFRHVAGLTNDQVMALEPKRMQGRSDVFPAGIRILDRAATALASPVLHVSRYGVRHGVALRYLRELAG